MEYATYHEIGAEPVHWGERGPRSRCSGYVIVG